MDSVPLDDRGLLLGDGLFETLLWRDGALALGEAHAAWMIRAAAALGLPAPSSELFLATARQAVADAGLETARAAVRVTLTAGSGARGLDRPTGLEPRLFATASPSGSPLSPAVLMVAETRRNEASPASRLKTLSYLDNVMARREATAVGAHEAVMLNTQGEIAGATAANLFWFWVKDERLFAPPLEAGRLDGVMAGAVVEAARRQGIDYQELRIGADALASADTVFLTSSLIGVRPARLAAAGAVSFHPMIAALAEAVREIS